MENIEVVKIEVAIDASAVDEGLKALSFELGGVKDEINSIKAVIESGINELIAIISALHSEVRNIVFRVSAALKSCTAEIMTGVNSITASVDNIRENVKGNSAAEALSIGSDAIGIIASLRELFLGAGNLSNSSKKTQEASSTYTNDKGQLLLPGSTSSLDATSSGEGGGNNGTVNGLVGGIFTGMGDMSSMLPDAEMLKSLSAVITKLKESAAAWAKQMGAKIADKAVDLQIIALYAADYVKAFGAMIARIAASTAAWVKNTAAKVASTAAEWAQIAATTAWNALCAVATTVTTAFGAAMAFLTSPIGLVVVAITALIAIIVLLVKNWDTVKAAAVSVWEGIKATFSAVGAWFYQNVVAPVAGFFSGMWDGFRQAAVNAWEGVKAVFSTVAGFFGKVFSEAWAGVVKVFSAAGNIFVNIKDAIVSVFKSVVNGLIRGINSIVAIPFNGKCIKKAPLQGRFDYCLGPTFFLVPSGLTM